MLEESLFEESTNTPKGELILLGLLDQYKIDQKVIQVNFRNMVNWIPYGDRSSHKIHIYPAKLLPHIPAFFLANNILSKKNDLVLDSFGGSGTVMLEAALAGRNAISSDSNPLARLISKVKVTVLNERKLKKSYKTLLSRIEENKKNDFVFPDVVNINYWFHERVSKQLNCIKVSVEAIQDKDIREFFQVSFSNIIKRVSLSDPWVSVPVRLKKEKYKKGSRHYKHASKLLEDLETIDVYDLFNKQVEINIDRISTLNNIPEIGNLSFKIFDDARKLDNGLTKIEEESVQLIISSPPYAGAQKYIRSSSLSLGWLGFCKSNHLRNFQKLNIGRENYKKAEYVLPISTGIKDADSFLLEIFEENPLRAHITTNYLIEMRDAFKEIVRVMKPNGYFVLVSSANQICGKDFATHKYLSEIAVELGLTVILRLVDDIHSRGLMTKRNKTAGMINSEWVYIFKKKKYD